MPTNLLKVYNQLLELLYPSLPENIGSLYRVFNRDFCNVAIHCRGTRVEPTPAQGEDNMQRLFRHLTTVITDEKTKKREFESARSIRLHWIRYHLEGKAPEKLLGFKVQDENRVYLLDKVERYVVILEPLRNVSAYYLLTAYPLEPASFKKILKKYETRSQHL
jgi:hypothetical protein